MRGGGTGGEERRAGKGKNGVCVCAWGGGRNSKGEEGEEGREGRVRKKKKEK